MLDFTAMAARGAALLKAAIPKEYRAIGAMVPEARDRGHPAALLIIVACS